MKEYKNSLEYAKLHFVLFAFYSLYHLFVLVELLLPFLLAMLLVEQVLVENKCILDLNHLLNLQKNYYLLVRPFFIVLYFFSPRKKLKIIFFISFFLKFWIYFEKSLLYFLNYSIVMFNIHHSLVLTFFLKTRCSLIIHFSYILFELVYQL